MCRLKGVNEKGVGQNRESIEKLCLSRSLLSLDLSCLSISHLARDLFSLSISHLLRVLRLSRSPHGALLNARRFSSRSLVGSRLGGSPRRFDHRRFSSRSLDGYRLGASPLGGSTLGARDLSSLSISHRPRVLRLSRSPHGPLLNARRFSSRSLVGSRLGASPLCGSPRQFDSRRFDSRCFSSPSLHG
ncbi:hypothetical protein YC2023_037351 [Brassica napus]